MGVACAASLMLLGAGALYMLGAQLTHADRVQAALGESSHLVLAVAFEIAFFLGVIAVVHHVVVRLTHAVAGPAFAIERGLKVLREGRRDARFALRQGDYLVPVAEAAEALRVALAERDETVLQELAHIRTAAGHLPDVAAALARLERAVAPLAPEGEAPEEPVRLAA